jgi:hypothetical protein
VSTFVHLNTEILHVLSDGAKSGKILLVKGTGRSVRRGRGGGGVVVPS